MAKKQGENWALVDLSGQNDTTAPGVGVSSGRLVVTIAGVELPVSQFTMRYAFNTIPDATVMVALGRDARTGNDSAVYAVVDKLKQMAEAKVEMTGFLGDWSPRGGANGSKQQWPSASAIIFMGYVSGIAYRRTSGQIYLLISLTHQLVDLTMSSGGSKDVVPGTPADLLLPVETPGAGSENAGCADTKYANSLEYNLATDFSMAILTCLHFVSQENKLQSHNRASFCPGEPLGSDPKNPLEGNIRVARIIDGYGSWRGIANQSTYGLTNPGMYPLQVPASVRNKAATTISGQISASLAATSIWGVLTNSILPDYGCAIIPLAQNAVLAPLLAMARESQISISPDDYVDLRMNCASQRPLYGVGVLANYQMATVHKEGSANLCNGSSFVAKADDTQSPGFNDGMWMFVNAPRWMDDWTNTDPKALKGNANVNDMLNKPAHNAAGPVENAFERNPSSESNDYNDAMTKYAQLIYNLNSLRGRDGTLVGKLRFDIAPGTTIKIKVRGELMAGVDTLAVDMFGLVTGVSIAIDAEQGTASTSLQLINLRTAAENASDRYSMAKHPFFEDNYFKYEPLVPALSLPPDRS